METDLLDFLAKENGFENVKEMYDLVASIPLLTPSQQTAYRKWQIEDGTKAGLLKLLEETRTKNENTC